MLHITADLGAKAAGLSGYAATGSLIVVGAGLAVWGVKTLMSRHDQHVAQQHQQPSAANGSAGVRGKEAGGGHSGEAGEWKAGVWGSMEAWRQGGREVGVCGARLPDFGRDRMGELRKQEGD